MGLRTHAVGPIKQDPTPQDGCTTSKVAFKEEPDSQENHTQQDSASQAHCSANSLHAQGHLQGVTARSDTVNKPVCKMREVTADSEEVKRSSSREPDGSSPQSSNPASLGPHRMSSTQRQQSGDLQTGSGGECETMICFRYICLLVPLRSSPLVRAPSTGCVTWSVDWSAQTAGLLQQVSAVCITGCSMCEHQSTSS